MNLYQVNVIHRYGVLRRRFVYAKSHGQAVDLLKKALGVLDYKYSVVVEQRFDHLSIREFNHAIFLN